MKKRTRTLLALGMVAAMLVGCGSQPSVQPSESSDSQATESTQTSQPQESESQENSVEYPEYLNMESARPIVKEGEEVTLKVAFWCCRHSGRRYLVCKIY